MKPVIIIRSHNDLPLIADTLSRVYRQHSKFDLIAFDNASDDGTREEIQKYTDRIVHVPKGSYIPGRVLNQAMELATSEYVVFLNSDCTPQDEFWLERLLAGFTDNSVAAVFGRQIPRPDCYPLYRKDTEQTFGNGRQQQNWQNCFSMASSAVRRSVWKQLKFNETLLISEDIDWTWRARQAGYRIRYIPDSVVMHSHNYTLGQFYRRQYKEGRDDAVIFNWSPWRRSVLRYSFLPFARQVLSDWLYCLHAKKPGAAVYSPLFRFTQHWARRAGFRHGLKREAGRG